MNEWNFRARQSRSCCPSVIAAITSAIVRIISPNRRALHQILINLTSNAIKFTEHGTVRLAFRQCSDGARRFTEFSVTDTGVGIAAADREKLFQAFAQVGAVPRRRVEGTGLGLYLGQKLADLLGGRITFQSEPGKGTCFTLELPEA